MPIDIKAKYGKQTIQLGPSAQINSRGELMLYGVIGEWFDGMDAMTVVGEIDALEGDEIVVRFHSPGGNILEGLAMYNALKGSKKRVVGYIDGIAASMACAVAMACDHVHIPSNAMMMMHKPNMSDLRGQFNANDLREVAEYLDTFEPSYIELHANKTGKSSEEIAAILADGKNHFYRGQEAVDFGLADSVIDEVAIAAHWDGFDIASAQYFPISQPAAAAATPQNQEHTMFKLKTNGGSKYAAATAVILTALSATFQSVEQASAKLGVSQDALTGKTEIADTDITAMAEALDVELVGTIAASQPTASYTAAAPSAADVKAETRRVSAIYDVCAKANISDETRTQWIESGVSVDKARAQAFDHVIAQENSEGPQATFLRGPASADIKAPMAQAMLVRANPSKYQHSEASMEFGGMTLIEMAKAHLEMCGERIRGKNNNDIVAMAMHSSSDFPLILADVANKEMVGSYKEAPRTFLPFSRRSSASDFKAKNSVAVGGGSGLAPLNEKGELKRGTLSEAGSSYRLATYGREYVFGRDLLINDDMGALTDFMRNAGRAAARLESDKVYELIMGTPQYNGQNLYAASRNTQVSGSTSDMEVVLTAIKTAMRKQRGLDDEHLNLAPAFLLVGTDREVPSQKILTSVQQTKTGDVNVHANSMELIVESRMDGVANNPFYGLAHPSDAPVIEYCYLQGNDQPFIESEVMFGTRGMKLAIVHDFAAGIVGGRGIVKHVGA